MSLTSFGNIPRFVLKDGSMVFLERREVSLGRVLRIGFECKQDCKEGAERICGLLAGDCSPRVVLSLLALIRKSLTHCVIHGHLWDGLSRFPDTHSLIASHMVTYGMGCPESSTLTHCLKHGHLWDGSF